jgi:hypothetical protein
MTRGKFKADFSTVIRLVEAPPTQLVNVNWSWYERDPGNTSQKFLVVTLSAHREVIGLHRIPQH